MTGGIGFSRHGQKSHSDNRKLLKKNAPFQRIKDNPFINPPKLKFPKMTPELLEKLGVIKTELSEKSRIGSLILGVCITVIVAFYLASFIFL